MSEFRFYQGFKELEGIKGIKAGNKMLTKLCKEEQNCLGARQIGDTNYHVFYMKREGFFGLYYIGGGDESVNKTSDLDEMIEYVNGLKE